MKKKRMKMKVINIALILVLATGVLLGQSTSGITLTASTPSAPTCSAGISGSPGNTTIYYWPVANYVGGQAIVSVPLVVANAPNTLSGANFVVVSCNFPTSATTIDLLKSSTPSMSVQGTCSNCAIGTGSTSGQFNDQANTAPSPYTFSADTAKYAVLRLNTRTVNPSRLEVSIGPDPLNGAGSGTFIPVLTGQTGQVTGFDARQGQRLVNQSLNNIGAINPSLTSISGLQPTLFNVTLETNDTVMTNSLYGSFVSNNASGTRSNAIGIEGDAFQIGAGAVTNLIGNSGFAEQDAGTVGQIISVAAGGSAITGGTATAIISLYAGPPTQTGGTVQFSRVVEIADSKGIGATGSAGLWIDSQTGAATRAIFVAGANIVDFAAASALYLPGTGRILPKGIFSSLPSCATGVEGSMAAVTDSNTVTWGATIAGSSTNHVLAYCDGTNWTVAGK